ncbi:MAG: 50S ribosomal protein L31e [Candidatus Bathyarchaeia archaeon]
MSGSASEEKMISINLRRIYNYSGYARASKAVRFIREQAARHLKTSIDNIKIDESLNALIWSRGLKKPPRMIKVKVEKEEDNYVLKLAG